MPGGWPASSRRIRRAAYSPACMATSATPGSPPEFIMSPATEISGWPGMVRSGCTMIRPARSCWAPVAVAIAVASGGASTPAVHSTVPASCRVTPPSGPRTSSPVRSTLVTIECMCCSTPSLRSARAALADSTGPNEASGASPPSNSSTRASCGTIRRNSARSVRVASSRICPASSTPVGPPPTSANVSQRRASSWLVALSAISNAPNTRRRIVSASAIDFIPGANSPNSSCPKYDCCTPAATIRWS